MYLGVIPSPMGCVLSEATLSHALCRTISFVYGSHLFRSGTNAPGKSHEPRFARGFHSTVFGRNAAAGAGPPERAQRLLIEHPRDDDHACHQEPVKPEFSLGYRAQFHGEIHTATPPCGHTRA